MVESWITAKARKGVTSGIAGRGLIAIEPIGKDEIVAVKGGHIVTTAALHSLPERLQNSDIQITDDLHLVALTDDEYESVMLFLNHSCEPNVGFSGNIVLVAMRDIEPGEELTTDYALFDDYPGSMHCDCGSSLCRRRIDGRDWQRPELRERYRGYFSWYLERRIGGLLASRRRRLVVIKPTNNATRKLLREQEIRDKLIDVVDSAIDPCLGIPEIPS